MTVPSPPPWSGPRVAAEYDKALASVTADRDQLRKAVLDLAAELDGSSAATYPSRKSEIEREIAVRLRKIAGPPS